jgi:hypothetical protein
MNKNEVVAIGVFVEIVHLLDGARHGEDNILVEHQFHAPCDGVARWGHLRCTEVAVLQNRFVNRLDGSFVAGVELFHARWRIVMVQNRLDT